MKPDVRFRFAHKARYSSVARRHLLPRNNAVVQSHADLLCEWHTTLEGVAVGMTPVAQPALMGRHHAAKAPEITQD